MQVTELVLSMVLRLFECHYLLNRSAGWGRDKLRKVLGPGGGGHTNCLYWSHSPISAQLGALLSLLAVLPGRTG